MLGAMNIAQQRRFWSAIGREDMAKNTHAERRADPLGVARPGWARPDHFLQRDDVGVEQHVAVAAEKRFIHQVFGVK